MEMSTLSAMASSSSAPSTPLTFHHHSLHHNPNRVLIPNPINPRKTPTKIPTTRIRRKPIWAKATSTPQSSPSSWDSLGIVSPALPTLQELDPNYMLFRQRIIFIGSRILAPTVDFVISQLMLMDAEDNKRDIKIFINCPGGSVHSGMGIYDGMKQCKADISTICLGLAASTGALILAAGTKGKRFCMPNSRVMFHHPVVEYEKGGIEFFIQMRELRYCRLKRMKILSRITGKTVDQIAEDTADGFYMSAWEAKDYGIIDAIIDEGKPGLVAPIVDPSKPPPKYKIWRLWSSEGEPSMESQPSENKFVKQFASGDARTDDEEGAEEEKRRDT